MTNRTTKLGLVILSGALLGALLGLDTTPLYAADTCLSGPKGAAPTGSHWYYRIDHAAKRNCWYVRAEGGEPKSASSAVVQTSPQARIQSQQPLQPSVANARAQASAADIGQSNGVVADTTPSVPQSNGQVSNSPATDNGQADLASRVARSNGRRERRANPIGRSGGDAECANTGGRCGTGRRTRQAIGLAFRSDAVACDHRCAGAALGFLQASSSSGARLAVQAGLTIAKIGVRRGTRSTLAHQFARRR